MSLVTQTTTMTSRITQAQLRDAVSYDPETGVFRRRVSAASMAQAGAVAGSMRQNSSGKCYLSFHVLGQYGTAHRWAFLYMTGWMPEQVDHENGNGCDNRWVNLKAATNVSNSRNQRLRSSNTSGQMGVSWHAKSKQWAIRINVDGRVLYLGYRKALDEAIAVRRAAELQHGYAPTHGKPRPLFSKAEIAGEWAKHCLAAEAVEA